MLFFPVPASDNAGRTDASSGADYAKSRNLQEGSFVDDCCMKFCVFVRGGAHVFLENFAFFLRLMFSKVQ